MRRAQEQLLKNESEDGTYNSDLENINGSNKLSQLLLENELNRADYNSRNVNSSK